MDMIGRQKALADRVEQQLRGAGMDVLLAGGAPRDWHMGLGANDLDFYIQTENHTDAAEAVSDYLDIDLGPKGEEKYSTMIEDNPELLAVYEGEFMGQAVQFMFLSVEPLKFVNNNFDLSICKVWYENGEIGMGWEAAISFEEKVMAIFEPFNPHTDKLMDRKEWKEYGVAYTWQGFLNYMERREKRRPRFVNEIDINQMQVEF